MVAQEVKGQVISPERGSIYDRNGKELAINIPARTISVNPNLVRMSKVDIEQIALKITETLQVDTNDVLSKLKKASSYEVIKRKAETDSSDALKKWVDQNKIDGIYFEADKKRYYPNNNLAAHVIGITGIDNQGLSGIELSEEQYLKGFPGKIISEVDGKGYQIPFNKGNTIDVSNGLNVVLTLDASIQYFAEKALRKTIEDFKVLNGGTAIVMDPRNGDILAMASYPDFNLNNPFGAPEGVSNIDTRNWNSLKPSEQLKKLQETVWRNKALNDTYEPGSTFKSITAAAGLEEGIISPDTEVVDVPIKLADWTINSDFPGGHGKESFSQAIYNSDNPVLVKLSQALGIEKFYGYVKAFGFYDKTGIDLPGEAASIFQKRPREIDMATASFGQNFQTTPIQIITAYASFANGGKLIEPHLLKELTDSKGNVVSKYKPELIRNVISRQTADKMKDILEGVVEKGTGSNAYISGYRVAGKTGTAETFENGVRSKDHFVASFSAFAPVDNPLINVLVVLDYPSEKSHFGGSVAAPAASRIIEDTLNYLGVERKYTEKDIARMGQEVAMPDLTNKSVKDAQSTLTGLGLTYKVIGGTYNSNTPIADQIPRPGENLPVKSVVILFVNKNDKQTTVKMPDITNKNIYEATKVLNNVGLNIKIKGTGTAASQEYKAGTEVPVGKAVEVVFIDDKVD